MVLGSLTGALCGGWQSARFGRRLSMMFDCTIFIAGTVLSALAPHFYAIMVARFLLGKYANGLRQKMAFKQ